MTALATRAGQRPVAGDVLGLGRLVGEPSPQAEPQAPCVAGVRPRVLLVDDEAGIREELAALLEEEDIAVVGAADDGVAGVELALRLRPDVILMDLRMPKMGGIEATRRVRDALPRTHVVLLSAYEDAGLQIAAREAGAYAYLTKGGSLDEVLDAIQAAASCAQRSGGQEEQR